MTEHAAPIHASAPAGPVDLARLEALAETATDHIWSVPKGGLTSEYVAALANAVPSLLAAARAVERVRAIHYARTITSWSDAHLDAEHDEGGDDCYEGECLAEHTICDGDGYAWPCTTVAALDGAE